LPFYILEKNYPMKALTPVFLLFCLTTLIGHHAPAQNALNQKIEAVFREMDHQLHPGAAVGIWKDGKILFAEGYGYANLEHRVPFTAGTVSDMGSVAKQFTCMGIVLLAEAGTLSLDDDIRKHLDFVPDFGKVITIRHLIHHTSGLREIYSTEAMRGGRSGDAIFQRDVVELVKRQQDLNFPPGDQYMYCNTAYSLLAEIIMAASGRGFEEWMQENIFRPLGMQHTYIMDLQGEFFPHTADSYYHRHDSLYVKAYDNSTINGQEGMYSSLEDMMKWLANLAEPQAGFEKAVTQMQSRGILNSGDTLNYAFGLEIENYRGVKRIRHTGSSAGYRAVLCYFPNQDLGFVIKTNSPAVPREKISNTITEFFLGEILEPAPESPESRRDAPEERTTLNPQDYTGSYYSPELETSYQIIFEHDQLQGRHFRHGTFVLQATGEDGFSTRQGFISRIRFVRDKNGHISGLYASSGGALKVWFKKE
jgi:CubicO group peptidase (beta-lactamase class C family)